jgi:hypothetical protein
VVYVCFLATILLLGGYGWWKTLDARPATGWQPSDEREGGRHRLHGGLPDQPGAPWRPADNVWYGGVTEADVPTLVDQHLIGGEPVEMLHIGPDRFLRLKSAHN